MKRKAHIKVRKGFRYVPQDPVVELLKRVRDSDPETAREAVKTKEGPKPATTSNWWSKKTKRPQHFKMAKWLEVFGGRFVIEFGGDTKPVLRKRR